MKGVISVVRRERPGCSVGNARSRMQGQGCNVNYATSLCMVKHAPFYCMITRLAIDRAIPGMTGRRRGLTSTLVHGREPDDTVSVHPSQLLCSPARLY